MSWPGPGDSCDGELVLPLAYSLFRWRAGRDAAEIAGQLHISTSTVKFHVASLMTKLSARNRVELAMWAYDTNRMK